MVAAMIRDLETTWRQGCTHAIRQMPRHWALHDPDAGWDEARSLVWVAAKTIVGAAAVIVLYAVVA